MYSMLIVDDEKWVRQGLKQTIDWHSHGIEVWGEAENGEEAFAWLSRSTPDIVITDIKMPGMDGLSLLEHINESKLHTKVIIISGYGEFIYAQKALKCGAYGYVLKPIEEQTLLEVVQKCVEDLERDSNRTIVIEEMRGLIRECMPLARQRYLELLLLGESVPDVQHTDATWRALQLKFNPGNIQVAVVRVHDWACNGETRNERSSILYGLGNIAEELLGDNGFNSVFCKLSDNGDADLAIVFSPEPCRSSNTEAILPAGFQQILEESKRLLKVTASIGVSGVNRWNKLSRAYTEAAYACSYSFFKGQGKLYECNRLPPQRADLGIPYVGPSTEWENRLIHAVKIGDSNLLEQTVMELQEHVEGMLHKYDPLQLTRGLRMLLSNLFFKLKSCLTNEQPMDHNLVMEIPLYSFKIDEFSRKLLTELLKWSSRIKGTASYSRLVELGLEYIGKHFTEQITLQDISNHLYVNASYFSKLFHDEVGQTFMRYVAGLRISKAKQLLKDTTMKIYEIADEVGYNDFRHFVKTFKEIVGLTPSQYRDCV